MRKPTSDDVAFEPPTFHPRCPSLSHSATVGNPLKSNRGQHVPIHMPAPSSPTPPTTDYLGSLRSTSYIEEHSTHGHHLSRQR